MSVAIFNGYHCGLQNRNEQSRQYFWFCLKRRLFSNNNFIIFYKAFIFTFDYAFAICLSLNKFLFPLGLILLAYRSYLLGLNICFMIIIYGFSGAILSIFIILPCHLVCLAALSLFYILVIRTRQDYCNFGGYRFSKQRLFILLGFFIAILLICLIESILLAILSVNVILVI